MTNTTNDPFMQTPAAPAIKFVAPGEIHTIIVRKVDERVDTDINNQVKTWANGDPKKVWIFTGTDPQGDPVSLWVRGNLVKAIREATQKAGLNSVLDTKVTVKFTAFGEAQKGMNAPKLFAAKVEAVTPLAGPDEEEPF